MRQLGLAAVAARRSCQPVADYLAAPAPPRASAPGLPRSALAGLPQQARAGAGRSSCRAGRR
jgi:hypothetical protein